MATEEQDHDSEMAQAELNDDVDFQSRFTFSTDLPPPDEWRDRTRTYPSQKNDRRNVVPARPPPSRPLPPPPPPLPASSLTNNTATETDLPDGPVQPPAKKGITQVQPASEASPEPSSSLSSLSPPPSSESPPPTSHSTPSQSSKSNNSVSADSKQGSSSSDSNRPRAGSKSKLAPPKRRPPPPPQQPNITVTAGNGKTPPPAPTTSQSSSTTEATGNSGTVDSSQTVPQVNGVGAESVVAGQTTAGVSGDQTNVGVESGLVTSNLKTDVGTPGGSNQSSLRVETNEHSKGSGTVSPLLSRSWDNIEIPLRVED